MSSAETLVFLGDAEQRAGSFAAAMRYYQKAIVLLRSLGERWLLSLAELQLGHIALEQGDYATAWTQIEQWLMLGRESETTSVCLFGNNLRRSCPLQR
jgi:tetratricopeptide (TPR) repeat protein